MVSSIDGYRDQANVLMLKKAMEAQKAAVAVIDQTLAKQQEAAGPAQSAMQPNLGARIDLRI